MVIIDRVGLINTLLGGTLDPAGICIVLHGTMLLFLVVFAARRIMMISLVNDITLKSSQVVCD